MSAVAQIVSNQAAMLPRRVSTASANRKIFLRPTKEYSPRTGPADSWAPVPHLFWSLAGKEKVSGAVQMSVLGYIMARTWGDPDKPAWALATIADMARELKCSTKMVELALADAAERGLIAVKKTSQQRSYQLTPQRWADAPKYVPKKAVDDEELEDEPAPDEEPADAGAKTAYKGETLVVMPGKRSKVLPLRFALHGHADPVELKLEYRNEVPDFPLAISATAGAGGRFSVVVSRHAEAANGEGKAKNLRNALRRFGTETADDQHASDYRKYLSHLLLERFSKPLDERFLASVLNSAKNTPIEAFSEVVEQRFRRGRHHTTGLLIELAKDAATLHAARTARAARPAAAAAASTAPVSNDSADGMDHAALREFAAADPDDYERMRVNRVALGETWPTLADLGVSR